MRLFACRLGVCAAMIVGLVSAPSAGVIQVNNTADLVFPADGACTFREALNNANLPAGGDTTAGDCDPGSPGIDTILVPGGTYSIQLFPAGDDANLGGDFDVLDGLALQGDGPAVTIIDGATLDRVLDVNPGNQIIEVDINNLALTGGSLSAPSRGGGMRIGAGATVSFTEGRVFDNIAEQGGGIFNEARLFAAGVLIDENRAPFGNDGGGLYNAGNADLLGCTVRRNSADTRGGGIHNAGQLLVDAGSIEANTVSLEGGGLYNADSAQLQMTSIRDNISDRTGGGIHHASGFLEISEVQFAQNFATDDGGGIYSVDDLQIAESTFSANHVSRNGGAIAHVVGSLGVDGSLFEFNEAGVDGGAIFNSDGLELTGATLRNNNAPQRGGGIFNTGNAVIGRSTLDDNGSQDLGGGIYNGGFLEFGASLASNNTAALYGGGIYADPASVSNIVNSTISGNVVDAEGGGIYNEGAVRIEFSTVARNTSTFSSPGGLFNASLVEIKNSILADNSGGDCLIAGALNSDGYNLDTDGSCGLGGAFDLSGVSPNLGPLQNNGGPTATHALIAPSPAIDTAAPGCQDQFGGIVSNDQRLFVRPKDGDGNGSAECDRGAYEAPSASPVSPPPVPDGIVGSPLRVGKATPAAIDLPVTWDVATCPAQGYHLLFGALADVSAYSLAGSECGLSVSGSDTWFGSASANVWFVIVPDDASVVEGSWGNSTSGIRNGATPSNECGLGLRDNSGTCP